MTKKQYKRTIRGLVDYDILNAIDQLTVEDGITLIKEKIKEFKEKNPGITWEEFRFNIEYCDEFSYLEIQAERQETEEEVKLQEQEKQRIEKENKKKIKKLELKELERLKKKYEKSRTSKKDNT